MTGEAVGNYSKVSIQRLKLKVKLLQSLIMEMRDFACGFLMSWRSYG